MIKDLFLPEKMNGYYLFAKRIVGFDIGKTHVSATQVFFKGKTATVEKYVAERIEAYSANNADERTIAALKKVVSQLDAYDAAHTTLSSAFIVFKELTLPFLGHDKINMVVRYEVEPLLPFPIAQATIDFIITKQNPEEGNSQILVAAVQDQHIAHHLELLNQAGIKPEKITVDLFSLYGFYRSIPQYAHLPGGVALIDLGVMSSRIAYIHDGQLRFIRTINKGSAHLAKALSEGLSMQPNEAMENLIRYGLEKGNDSRYMQVIEQACTRFWQEIQLTLQSFSAQADTQGIKNVLLLGGGAEIKGITHFVSSLLHVSCSLLHCTDILYDTKMAIKNNVALPSGGLMSLSAALPDPLTEQFNLMPRDGARDSLAQKQLIAAGGLCLAILGTLAINSFVQLRSLRNEVIASADEAIQILKDNPNFNAPLGEVLKEDSVKKFNREAARQNKLPQELVLAEAQYIAQQTVSTQEKMWFAFSGGSRASFLTYLLEITNAIDKEALGFNLEGLTIAEGFMTLKGRVKNSEALKILEKEIRASKYFKLPETAEEPVFTLKIKLEKP